MGSGGHNELMSLSSREKPSETSHSLTLSRSYSTSIDYSNSILQLFVFFKVLVDVPGGAVDAVAAGGAPAGLDAGRRRRTGSGAGGAPRHRRPRARALPRRAHLPLMAAGRWRWLALAGAVTAIAT